MQTKLISAIALTAALAVSGPAFASTTFTDPGGTYSVGVGANGELYDNNTGVGLRNPAGSDYIAPGTPRDSWGITSSAGSAAADQNDFGNTGLVSTVQVTGPNTATFTTTTTSGLTVQQVYNFFAPNILSIQETVTNTNAFDVTGVVFRRNVDLDIPPTAFNENTVGPIGSNSAVVANSYYGFENPNPSVPYSFPCGSGCNQTGDLGMGIDLGLGNIAAGDSKTFAYYYGINAPGQTLDQLFTQAQGLGLSYLIGAQSLENGKYPALGANSGFLGVSDIGTVAGPGSGVPEPSTWLTMILGFAAIGFAMRSRRQQAKVNFAF